MSKLHFAALVLFLLFVGCDSNSDDGHYRVIQAAPNLAAVDIYTDGSLEIPDLAYGQYTDYSTIDYGSHNFQVVAPETAIPVINKNFSFGSDIYYSLFILASGRRQASNEQSVTTYIFRADPYIDTQSGQYKLRVANLAPVMQNSDVYITEVDSSIATRAPTFSGLSYKEFSNYFDLREGTVRVRVTASKSKEVVYDSGILNFPSGKVETLVIYDHFAGGFPLNGMVLEDRD